MPLNVLYIHHCGVFGGASRSLLELIRAFPPGSVNPYVITQKGTTAEYFRRSGIPVIESAGISQFDNSRYGHYRGIRWLILIRELFYLPFTLNAMIRARRKWKDIDLVHINEVTILPSILMARAVFGRPVVVHSRAVQRSGSESSRARYITRVLQRRAAAVIAIDQTVAKPLDAGLKVKVVHNGFSVDSPVSAMESHAAEPLPEKNGFTIGYVGNFLRLKGIFELVEAARLLRDQGIRPRFLMVGYRSGLPAERKSWLRKTSLIQDSTTEVLEMIENSGMKEQFYLIGFTADIGRYYAQMDVLCFPSHLNAAGRPVFEAAFYGVPSVVAIRDPLPDTIRNEVTGICIPEKDPAALANALRRMISDPELRKMMGMNAKELAIANFDIRRNAHDVLEIYKGILHGKG